MLLAGAIFILTIVLVTQMSPERKAPFSSFSTQNS